MQYSASLNLLGHALCGLIKDGVPEKRIRQDILSEYKNILLRAKDIGSKNTLLSSYALAAFFIAMNRKNTLTPDENIQILEKSLRTSKLVRAFLGDAKHYFSDKKMEMRRAWSKQTYERKYENDWVVDVLEKTDDYQFGFDYKECGVCKLCKDEGCFELAKYLCKLDFMLVEVIGIHLKRTMTLADGDEKCDFRFIR